MTGKSLMVYSQQKTVQEQQLTVNQQMLITISAYAAKGDLNNLENSMNKALDAKLSINEAKEALMHLYAYCGFPRSLRALQTLMKVIADRKAKGIIDLQGPVATVITDTASRYERGKKTLEKLTGIKDTGPKTGYAAFAPQIEVFLKEHLFADLFERDVLSYIDRELVTISVLASIGGVEPMLNSHINICLNLGLSPAQLQQFASLIQITVGGQEAAQASIVLNQALEKGTSATTYIFAKGEKITNANFTGTAYLNMLVAADNVNPNQIGSVTFEPGARTRWHIHKTGQVLLVTAGKGLYQEKGKVVVKISAGQTIKCPADVEHWHGATPNKEMTHLAISPKGSVIWLAEVTDSEYNSIVR